MLGFIRDGMKGWIAWAIIGVLIVPFALWGIQEYFGNGGPLVVATVNGEEVSQQSYTQAVNNQRSRMREMLGGQYNPDMFDDRIKKQALNDLIERELLFQQATEEGFHVAVASVQNYIRNIEGFQEDGRFSNEQYNRVLQSQGESATGFEARVQRGILTQQVYSGLVSSAIVTQADVEKLVGLEEQTREVNYLQIPSNQFANKGSLADEELKKYYNSHLQAYMTGEQVSIEYIELDGKILKPDVEPTEEQLQAYYQERSAQFTSTSERKTSHILITVEEGADEKTVQAAKAKALDVKSKLDKGESFKALAATFSDDPGSSKLGGDIGYFGKDSLDPNYEKTMFAMKVGDISEPVLSAFGYHIIKLDQIREPETKAFEDVRSELEKEYNQSAIDKKYYDLAETLTNLAYENTDTLEDAAGAIGIEIKSSDLFLRRGGVGITSNPKVSAAAFSDDVLRQGYNSEPIELGENHIIILRIKDHKEKAQKPFDSVKTAINTTVKNDNARQAAKDAGESNRNLLQAAYSDKLLKAIATELKLEWNKEVTLKRSGSKVNPQLVKAIFTAKRPATDKPTVKGLQLASGDYVIFSVTMVTDGKVADIDAAKTKTASDKLMGAYGDAAFSQFVSEIKGSANIFIRKNNL